MAAVWFFSQWLLALGLTAGVVFLRRTKRTSFMLYIPIFAMIAVTFTALGLTIYQFSGKLILAISMDIFGDSLQLVFAVLILGLGVFVAIQGTKKLFVRKQENRPSGGKKAEEPVQV